MIGAADVPLAEVAEAYRVEVMAGPDMIRAIETATPSAIYTAAQQMPILARRQAR